MYKNIIRICGKQQFMINLRAYNGDKIKLNTIIVINIILIVIRDMLQAMSLILSTLYALKIIINIIM